MNSTNGHSIQGQGHLGYNMTRKEALAIAHHIAQETGEQQNVLDSRGRVVDSAYPEEV